MKTAKFYKVKFFSEFYGKEVIKPFSDIARAVVFMSKVNGFWCLNFKK